MIVLALNSRGMARLAAIRNLRVMVCSINPSCIFIQETKITDSRLLQIIVNKGFVNHFCVPSCGTAGRLLLGWKYGVDIEITVANQFSDQCFGIL